MNPLAWFERSAVLAFHGLLLLALTGPGAQAATMAARAGFTCAVRQDGVQCWGDNSYGELGNSAFEDVAKAIDVDTLRPGTGAGVTAISAGMYHACAIVVGGLKCWGYNAAGQLGDGTITTRFSPVWIFPAGSRVTSVSAGRAHTCAVVDKAVYCWGGNSDQQLGDGTSMSRATPTKVIDSAQLATAVAAGLDHSCAVVGGGLRCWGANDFGQLGDNTTLSRSKPTVILPGSAAIDDVVVGYAFTCVLASGQAKCWGNNSSGQLGTGGTIAQQDAGGAVPVSGLGSAITAITAGDHHVCAVDAGQVKCWGRNTSGEIGDGTVTSRFIATARVGPAGTATSVAAGASHTCAAIDGAGGPFWLCWGEKGEGKLGNGDDVRQLTPTSTAFVKVPAGIEMGVFHGCAVMTDSSVQCWGSNLSGQLGDGTVTSHALPADVAGLSSGGAKAAAGYASSCAIVNGAVRCWGSNNHGQLGIDGTTSSLVPVTSLAASIATDLAIGDDHVCAVAASGIYCWGNNLHGQVGNQSQSDQYTPVLVIPKGAHVLSRIATGSSHTCAIVDAGVQCWGRNSGGEVGDPNDPSDHLVPYPTIPANSGVTAIAAGDAHTCVVMSGGVSCWGRNMWGQLGDGTTVDSADLVASPYFISGYGISAVTAGSSHTCVLGAGRPFCWGRGDDGQLGVGTHDTWTTPVIPLGLGYDSGISVTAIAAGGSATCARTNVGPRCWGSNENGVLPFGVVDYHDAPVVVQQNDVIFANRFEVRL